ncbi:aminomethyltransferase family protein [Phyllobacterium sophorae]|uniref:Glycine cleavage system protein T n=1 Tax=Phyllobacterium sophorae TaxID=1520277 RepID=A0A2P7B6S2_9HYPH|nr:aminomethyltransferase family protein [Phyllobacterium sophorae]PSH62120.1 glycine cleavage system protein T [Phyllobacterium sophorae]
MHPNEIRKTPEGYFTTRWGLPEYTDWIDESMSWKQTCSIGDWSFLWERRFKGPDALKLFSDTSINSFQKFDVLQSKHVTHTNKAGKVIAEGILTRLSDSEYMLFGRGTFWVDYIRRKGNYDVESVADDWFNFQVAGPTALALLEKVANRSLRDVKFMRSIEIEIAGCTMLALRQGMSGEVGFELQGPREQASQVYDAIVAAGPEFGLRRLGGRAVFINHLEACFPTIITDYMPAIFDEDLKEYRDEFQAAMPSVAATFNIAGSFASDEIRDWYRSPVELGWGKNIKFDHDFIGRAALEEEVANPRRAIRTLVWNSEDIADVYASLYRNDEVPYQFMEMPRDQRGFMYADRVLVDGQDVGVATSRGYSYFFREMLSLCVIDIAHAEVGTDVVVVWGEPGQRQKKIRAKVARAPYKNDNRRADLAKL